MVMLWRGRGCVSLEQWVSQFPYDALLLFRSTVSVAAQTQHRQRDTLSRLKIFSIGDPGMDTPEIQAIINDFVKIQPEKLWIGLQSRYWHRVRSKVPKDLEGDVKQVQEYMSNYIWEERLLVAQALAFARFSVAPVENAHAKHRQSAVERDQPVSFARLAAGSVQRQTKETGLPAENEVQTTSEVVVARPVNSGHMDMSGRMTTYKRAHSSEFFHRVDWIQEQRALCHQFDPCTKSSWARWRLDWEALPDERKAVYVIQANACGLMVKAGSQRVDGD